MEYGIQLADFGQSGVGAPGASDNVTIAAGGSTITITGSGALQSASLAITGPVDLVGS